MRFEKGKLIKDLTTLGIGGRAKLFATVHSEKELEEVFEKADSLLWFVIGSGSNVVGPDGGFDGLIIKININQFKNSGSGIIVGGGNNLLAFIKKINSLGYRGMEKMAGIPGTIAGAIYGNAGAYGQEIKDNITRVRIFDGKHFRWISRKVCEFGYRSSIFKKNKNWIIVGAEFKLEKGDPEKLEVASRETMRLRYKKYKRGILCPGSFFKNIVLGDLGSLSRKKLLSRIDQSKINHGKLPTGYLLEEVGAKGMSSGKIFVSEHHGNLIFNNGGGRAKDIKILAKKLKEKVFRKFGIMLEEEVQYL